MTIVHFFARNTRMVGALMMREMVTRYGRQGLGFVWVIGEPLLFCFGVLVMWSIIKPEYEHGVRLGPFVMTGYMALLLLRHQISFSIDALRGNIGLLHHRQIAVLHLYLARNILEFVGATAAFVVVYVTLLVLGQVTLPHDILALYGGWLLMGWMSMGLAMLMSGFAMRFDFVERLVALVSYVMIPASGAFVMASWIPQPYRDMYLLIPFPHAVEMIRAGVFGEFVATYYSPLYAVAWGSILNLGALLVLSDAREHIDIE